MSINFKECMHVKGIMRLRKPLICAWCGKPACTVCGKCKDNKGKRIVLHYNTKAGDTKGHQYFYHYYNNTCFGLDKNDANSILSGKKGDWKLPSNDDFKENASYIESLASLSIV